MSLLKYFSKKELVDYPLYFDLFESIYLSSPRAFFWIKPFTGKAGRYVISHFKEQFFTKYSGLELVIVDRNMMTYHRLPGAKPNGHGKVEIGNHYISVNSMHDKDVSYVHVKKINLLDVLVESIAAQPQSGISYQPLECRAIARELFVPEFVEIILSGLEWHYRSLVINAVRPGAALYQLLATISREPVDARIKMLAARIIALAGGVESISATS
jgi:hypothetical protein